MTTTPEREDKVPLFGARAYARKTKDELARTSDELAQLRAEMDKLGALDVAELEREKARLTAEIEAQRIASRKELDHELEALRDATTRLNDELTTLRAQVVTTKETAVLQEVGIYEYRHPLDDSTAYKDELAKLQRQVKELARRDGGAIEAIQSWTVNGSAAEGRRMVRDFSKLMLRAYNAEADNLVRGMKPYKLASAIDRLNKVTATIERLGRTMQIRIASPYHRLRIRELELTADYQEKLAREKEDERAERERLREEKRAQQELDRERQRLEKERQHYSNALEALVSKGDQEGSERIRAELDKLTRAIEDVDYRAANARAGYVYVISNVGSFGERMIKVGMTRRLEPRERVRELSDASVPFNFDIHALFFSDDAVGIEAEMHRRLADKRVNKVNLRREFFYVTPSEAKEHLLDLAGELLTYDELPEAVEYHQSQRPTPAG